MVWIQVMLFITVHPSVLGILNDVETSCEAPSVPNGEETTITCNFSEDISKSKRVFSVNRYSFDVPNTLQNIALDCYWPVPNPDTADCHVSSGYTFDYLVTNTLKLKIPNTTQQQEGQYICQVESSHEKYLRPCSLTLKTEASSTTEIQPTKTTQSIPDQPAVALSSGATVGIVLSILILLAVAAVVIYKCRVRLKNLSRLPVAQTKAPPETEDL